MPRIHASAAAHVPAPPARVFALLSDYREGHPRILPPEYFDTLKVEAGGTGEGTRIRYAMRSFGRLRWAVAEVSEPEPGRVLVETDVDRGIVTTFTVDPDGAGSRVRIETAWNAPGLSGWMLRLLTPAFLRKVFAAELRLLAEVAGS